MSRFFRSSLVRSIVAEAQAEEDAVPVPPPPAATTTTTAFALPKLDARMVDMDSRVYDAFRDRLYSFYIGYRADSEAENEVGPGEGRCFVGMTRRGNCVAKRSGDLPHADIVV